jgi:acyl CoA:acetate/3-ketoacid CoA transferase alpha subunit
MKREQNKRISVADAVASIEDGSHLTFSGFAHSLAPIALVHEIIRQGKGRFPPYIPAL